MAVVIETTLGDITVDLFIKDRPVATLNFLKLCKIKYYNYNLFHMIQRGFIAQTGDPTGSGTGGSSIYGVLEGPQCNYFPAEKVPKIKHTRKGLISFVGNSEGMIASQFFITLEDQLTYLDQTHCVFGEVMEGLDVLELLNEAICDTSNRPYKDIRITHTVILEDPFVDVDGLFVPERSPSPSAERLRGGRIAPDEDIDDTDGKDTSEISEMLAVKEAKSRATILEMVGDLPEADMAPPENVLFVCKLNPVTKDDDLEIIFGRFGKVVSCEVIRDKKTGGSLQYAFVEFDNPKSCEEAYFKMDNVLIDDRRIHVDFSQSVARVKWHGKGRGVTTYDNKGKKTKDHQASNLGKGIYEKAERNGRGREKIDNTANRRERNDRSDRHRDRHDSRKEEKHAAAVSKSDSSRYSRRSEERDRSRGEKRSASANRNRDRRDSPEERSRRGRRDSRDRRAPRGRQRSTSDSSRSASSDASSRDRKQSKKRRDRDRDSRERHGSADRKSRKSKKRTAREHRDRDRKRDRSGSRDNRRRSRSRSDSRSRHRSSKKSSRR